ncbi:hypothetical protein NDU88_012229 [Pleurodeles waltl]|uniref:Uncharacterized protein n=1 Tax=Pleurodeles waltl TaxID=8319 RepID=A0AAV7R3L7_PLEWA|nr:hypothetical protein NDU88_012229 [Pleurodeles waltl]
MFAGSGTPRAPRQPECARGQRAAARPTPATQGLQHQPQSQAAATPKVTARPTRDRASIRLRQHRPLGEINRINGPGPADPYIVPAIRLRIQALEEEWLWHSFPKERGYGCGRLREGVFGVTGSSKPAVICRVVAVGTKRNWEFD